MNPSVTFLWLFHPPSTRLYQQITDGFAEWHPVLDGRRSLQGSRFCYDFIMQDELPDNCHIANVTFSAEHTVNLDLHCLVLLMVTSNTGGSFEACQLRSPASEVWALDKLHIVDEGWHVATAIISNACKAVSDGSFKAGQCTSAYMLQGFDSSRRIDEVNLIPASEEDSGPYHGELGGIAGILTVAKILCSLHDIQEGGIKIGSDGLSTFYNIKRPSPSSRHSSL